MTVSEMHLAFKFGLDKLDSLNYPDFLPTEIDLLLNKSQDRFVKQRYGTTNNKKQSFEETQKRTEDIKNVVTEATLTPVVNSAANVDSNAQFVVLPTDHWITILELTGVSYLDCKGDTQTERVYTKAIQHNDYSKVISNPFEKPNTEKVLRLMSDGKVELLHASNVTLVDYFLRYIKEPVRISISIPTDCELSELVHEEIVNGAVTIALEGIEAKRLQSFAPVIQNTEE